MSSQSFSCDHLLPATNIAATLLSRLPSAAPLFRVSAGVLRYKQPSSSAMAEQFQQTKDAAAHKADETAQFGQEKAGEAQSHVQGLGETTRDKANEAGEAGQGKWGQTKQGAADAAHTAQVKAEEAKDKTGNVIQQATDNIKNAFSGNK